jgi:hypothetical protein
VELLLNSGGLMLRPAPNFGERNSVLMVDSKPILGGICDEEWLRSEALRVGE